MGISLAVQAHFVADSTSSGIIARKADFRGESALLGSIAQRLEQGSHKPLVLGSNPSTPSFVAGEWRGSRNRKPEEFEGPCKRNDGSPRSIALLSSPLGAL